MRIVTACLFVLLAACAPEPLEFADWTIPVPEGTPIIEYAAVPTEERTERIELVEDLMIGERGEDPDFLFFWPQAVAVDGAGRMYVSDTGNTRVQVFGANGEFLRTLGREGQGPGELQGPFGIAMTGDRVIVNDVGNERLSIWDLNGVHFGDIRVPGRLEPAIFGTHAGSIVGAMNRRRDDRAPVFDVAMFSAEGTETIRYARLPRRRDFLILLGGGFDVAIPRMTGVPSYAAAPSGNVYATVGEEYQVVAFDPAGSPLWALRTNRQRQAFDEEHKNIVLEGLRSEAPGIGTMQAEWPDFLPSIGRLAVDGHGHLYVFSYVFRDPGLVEVHSREEEVLVEVYSREGERLFAGMMVDGGWSAARGDFVYSLRRNEQTEEQELVRYRLVEPF